jgi:hypothetical protein
VIAAAAAVATVGWFVTVKLRARRSTSEKVN